IRDFHVTGVQTCALPILPMLRLMRSVTAGPGTTWSRQTSGSSLVGSLLAACSEDTVKTETSRRTGDTRISLSLKDTGESIRDARSEERRVGKECGSRGWR